MRAALRGGVLQTSSLGPMGVVWVVGVTSCTDGRLQGAGGWPPGGVWTGGRGLAGARRPGRWAGRVRGRCARPQDFSLSLRAAGGSPHAAVSSVLQLAGARPVLQALPLLLRRGPARCLLRAARPARRPRNSVTRRTRTRRMRPSLQSAACFFGIYT